MARTICSRDMETMIPATLDPNSLYPPDTLLGTAFVRFFDYGAVAQQGAEIVQEEEAETPLEAAEPSGRVQVQ